MTAVRRGDEEITALQPLRATMTWSSCGCTVRLIRRCAYRAAIEALRRFSGKSLRQLPPAIEASNCSSLIRESQRKTAI